MKRPPQSNNKSFERSFVHDITTEEALIQKELLLIDSEESLLKQRIQVMKDFIKELPSKDPQYGMMEVAIDMDLIELDEYAAKRLLLLDRLDNIKHPDKKRK